MKWFMQEDLALVTLYFGEPDSTGHRYGPESPERKEMVKQVDRTVGYSLDLIITSDHGMTTVNKKASDLVEFHKFPSFTFQDIEFELLDYGPNGVWIPKEGKMEVVYSVFEDIRPRLHVYKKEFPKTFRCASNPRITPLLLHSDLGYVIHGVSPLLDAWLRAGGFLLIYINPTPFFFLLRDWWLNSGLRAYRAGALLLEPLPQSILLWLFFGDGSHELFSWAVLKLQSSHLILPSR
jgi:predicted AlkP superfamily pyrophosphatase or phosphodiesterase